MPLPRDQLPIGEGLHPDGRGGAYFYVDRAQVDVFEEDGPEWKLEDSRYLVEAVANPDAIFQGLKRPGQEEGFAYSVRPMHDPDEESNPIPPRFGHAFVAFARLGIGGFVIFDWEWREEDADVPGNPVGWQTDFETRTWHKI